MNSFRHDLYILFGNFIRSFSGQWNFKPAHQRTRIHIVLKQSLSDHHITHIQIGRYAPGVITSYSIHYTKLYEKLTPVNLSEIPYYTFTTGEFAGVKDVILSNTGYTGAGGFELYFYPEHAEKIWNAIFETGAAYGIKPIGLGARDTLRLEKGFCLYGNDIDDTTSPIEAGLGWITRITSYNVCYTKLLRK